MTLIFRCVTTYEEFYEDMVAVRNHGVSSIDPKISFIHRL
jgi:hypothetical protein